MLDFDLKNNGNGELIWVFKQNIPISKIITTVQILTNARGLNTQTGLEENGWWGSENVGGQLWQFRLRTTNNVASEINSEAENILQNLQDNKIIKDFEIEISITGEVAELLIKVDGEVISQGLNR